MNSIRGIPAAVPAGDHTVAAQLRLLAVVSILGILSACGQQTQAPTSVTTPALASRTPASPVKILDGVQQVTVINGLGENEFKFLPSDLTLKPGKVQITFVNKGAIVHELMLLSTREPAKLQQFIEAHAAEKPGGLPAENVVPGVLVIPELEDVEAGASQTSAVFDLAPGAYQVACLKPGHYEAGMKGTITVA